jgi:hypothetical protein
LIISIMILLIIKHRLMLLVMLNKLLKKWNTTNSLNQRTMMKHGFILTSLRKRNCEKPSQRSSKIWRDKRSGRRSTKVKYQMDNNTSNTNGLLSQMS